MTGSTQRIPGAVPDAGPEVILRDDKLIDVATGVPVATYDDIARLIEPVRGVVELQASVDLSDGTRDDGGNSFCACAVEVRVDEATGAVDVVDALIAVDIGTVINPDGYCGQLEGGFVFGSGPR